MSAPPEKLRPAPMITNARTCGSWSPSLSASRMPCTTPLFTDSALTGGLFSVMTPTLACFWYSTKVVIYKTSNLGTQRTQRYAKERQNDIDRKPECIAHARTQLLFRVLRLIFMPALLLNSFAYLCVLCVERVSPFHTSSHSLRMASFALRSSGVPSNTIRPCPMT